MIPKVKPRLGFKELLRQPAAKSLFLTGIFGTAVTQMISQRKRYESLIEDHNIKMVSLRDIAQKLQQGHQVNLQQELKLLENKGDTEIAIDVDDKLNELLLQLDKLPSTKTTESQTTEFI